ncbi:MAG: O-antigen ligase family protein [Phycisphaerales bacterium]|nr:MAG: O-antigen ligase family protein [Phycisphaerales bacterium]
MAWATSCLVGVAAAAWYEQAVLGLMIATPLTLVGVVLSPTFALCCIALMLPLGGSLVYEGTISSDRVVGAVAALGILANHLATGKGIRIGGSPLIPLFLIVVWSLLAVLWAAYPMVAVAGAFTLVQLAIWGLAVWNALAYGRHAIWPLRCYAGGTLVIAGHMFWTGSIYRMARSAERVTVEVTAAINPADFAVLLGVAFFVTVYLILRDPTKWLRPVWALGALIFPAIMIQTGSRGPLLALGAAIFISLFTAASGFRKSKAMLIGVAAMLVLAAGGAYWSMHGGFISEKSMERLTSSGEKERAASFRLYLAKTGVDHVLRNPLGVGLGNYTLVGVETTVVHMEILFLGTELGIPAMVLYVWFFWKLGAGSLKTKSPAEKWFLQTMVVFLMAAACIHVIFFRKVFWFSTIAAAAIAYRSRQEEGAQPYAVGQASGPGGLSGTSWAAAQPGLSRWPERR